MSKLLLNLPFFLIFICVNYSALASEDEYLCTQYQIIDFVYKTDSNGRAVQDENNNPVLISEERRETPHKIIFKIKRDRNQPKKVYFTDILNSTREFVDGGSLWGPTVIKEDDDKINVQIDDLYYSNLNVIEDFEKGDLISLEIIFFKKTNQLFRGDYRNHQHKLKKWFSPSRDTTLKYFNCDEL